VLFFVDLVHTTLYMTQVRHNLIFQGVMGNNFKMIISNPQPIPPGPPATKA
jgi:hypothetical protein